MISAVVRRAPVAMRSQRTGRVADALGAVSISVARGWIVIVAMGSLAPFIRN